MLESQREQEERRRTLQNDQRVLDQHFDPATLKNIRELERLPEHVRERVVEKIKQAEKARASTLHQFAQAELETSRDRFGVAQGKPTVVGKAPVDPWGPPRPDYWAAADMGQGPTFGKQLHSVDRERGK